MAHSDPKIESLLGFVTSQLVSGDMAIDYDSNLSEVGLDSFSFMEMVLFAERNFGIKIPLEKLTSSNLSSIRTFYELIQSLD